MPTGVQTEVKTYQMFINGEWVASKSAKTFPVYDPSTEEVIAQVPDASADDVNRAVAAAKAAFEEGPWATTTAQERGRVLFRLADKVRQNLPALAHQPWVAAPLVLLVITLACCHIAQPSLEEFR